jgi:glucose-1-phosphatase
VPEALLFDLGGVVIDLDFGRVFDRWAALSGESAATLRSKYSFDHAYERHERGEIDAAEYFGGLRATLGIDLTLDEFVDGWNCVYLGPVPSVVDLLSDLAERLPLYALTNSNPSHVECWSQRYAAELSMFRSVFISSTMGVRKPEPASFQMVTRSIGLPPDAVHFLDDSAENVRGARAAGMKATLVRSSDDIRSIADSL